MQRARAAQGVGRLLTDTLWNSLLNSARAFSSTGPCQEKPLGLKKLLVANRGAIAAKCLNTARRLGMETVAVYSDEDANAYHTTLADERFRLVRPCRHILPE